MGRIDEKRIDDGDCDDLVMISGHDSHIVFRQESRKLVKAWDIKKKMPHFLSQIKKTIKSKRQLKGVSCRNVGKVQIDQIEV